jgi:outer membrane translocation and assembly module TamA
MNITADRVEVELPLKKPETYDFSVRRVDWKKYDNDYLLRTDAVWEKSKLFAYFHSLYKAVIKNK